MQKFISFFLKNLTLVICIGNLIIIFIIFLVYFQFTLHISAIGFLIKFHKNKNSTKTLFVYVNFTFLKE